MKILVFELQKLHRMSESESICSVNDRLSLSPGHNNTKIRQTEHHAAGKKLHPDMRYWKILG
jgi:hypothetical protein